MNLKKAQQIIDADKQTSDQQAKIEKVMGSSRKEN